MHADNDTSRPMAGPIEASDIPHGCPLRGPQGALPGPAFEKVIVAIHGIGNQRRSDTIRSVARRFGDREDPPLPVHPLGFFHVGDKGEARLSRLDVSPSSQLAKIGFAEIFWADVPREADKRGDTLEEITAWGRTVASRAEALYRAKQIDGPELEPGDFQHGAGILDEVVETLGVMENLLLVLDKMGIRLARARATRCVSTSRCTTARAL